MTLIIRDFRATKPGQPFVNNVVKKMKTESILGQTYRSTEAASQRGSHLQVLFPNRHDDGIAAWPGQVQYFFEHILPVEGQPLPHVFAFIK